MRKQWAILYIYFFKHEKIKMIRETKKDLSHCIVYSLQNCQNIIEIGVWDLSWAKYMPFFLHLATSLFSCHGNHVTKNKK